MNSKYCRFVREPLGNKKIDTVNGVGKVNSRRFKTKGYNYASNLVGVFMMLNNNRSLFEDCLKHNGISYQSIPFVADSIEEWVRLNA